jgi:hypothetical protein
MPSKSKAQQRYFGMVHACKKSDYKDCASKEVEDTARGMKAKDAKEFASTKHKGLPEKKETNEMTNLIKDMIREILSGGENLNAEEPEPEGMPIEGQELRDALAQDISDMYKEMHGIRPRWYNWQEMPLEALERLHGSTVADLQNYAAEERHYDDQAWKEDDPDTIARAEDIEAEYDAEKARLAAEEEEERMRTPEAGEEFPKRTGMRRRMNESAVRRDTANKLYNLLIMEQEYGIITPHELAELKAAINKVLGVSVGNLL